MVSSSKARYRVFSQIYKQPLPYAEPPICLTALHIVHIPVSLTALHSTYSYLLDCIVNIVHYIAGRVISAEEIDKQHITPIQGEGLLYTGVHYDVDLFQQITTYIMVILTRDYTAL